MRSAKPLYRILMSPGDPALGMTLDGLSLAFKGKFAHLEDGLLEEYTASSVQQVRIGIVCGAVLISLFGILDFMTLDAERALIMTIRYGILVPALAIGFAITFTSIYKKHPQILTAAMVAATGLLLSTIVIIAPISVSPLYFAGNILLIFYSYSFVNLRFIYASLASWFVAIIYPIGSVAFSAMPLDLLLICIFFTVSTSILGMFVNYSNEFQTRRNYFLRYALNEHRSELEKARDELEIKVEERTREAREAARAKADFLANMSHEIRTPMNGVLGMLDLLRDSKLDASQQGQIDTAYDSARGLLHIINDVLDLSKIEAGKMSMHYEPAVPAEIVEQVCALLYPQAKQKRLELVSLLDRTAYQHYSVDAVRFRQILFNLIGNAIKFTNDGEVVVRCQINDGKLHLLVKDTGIGLSPDQQSDLFDAFHQAENAADRQFGGTGLGLTITRQLAELMGGSVTVNSRLGEGSEFNLEVSISPIANQESPVALNKKILLDLHKELDSRTLINLLHILRCELVEDSSADMVICHPGESTHSLPAIYIDTALKDKQSRKAAKRVCCLALPITLRELTKALTQPVNASTGANQETSRGKFDGSKVLVVEDNPVNRKVAEAMLVRLGVKPAMVESGAEALCALDQDSYDLILMDCQMPGMDGFDTTEAIRQREAGRKLDRAAIVALTANAMAGDRKRCLDAGMDDYLPKPVSMDSLAQCLERWITHQELLPRQRSD